MASKLTDTRLRAEINKPREKPQVDLVDGAIAGLFVRLGRGGTATWSLKLRVSGEGGVTKRGHRLKGKPHRVTLGTYPELSIEKARSMASGLRDQAKAGQNPVALIEAASTAGGLTVCELSKIFVKQYVQSKELDSASKYQMAFDTHINPIVGDELADLLTREQARKVMDEARVKRKRPEGQRGGDLGGVEAARTVMGVLRHMYSWAMDESKIKRKDNPASKITKNLPKKKQGEVVLSTIQARIVWDAAETCGGPYGDHVQLQQLTGCRLDELASVEVDHVDLDEALLVIPADAYKSDHVHVVPLVPQAIEILKRIPKPTDGPYLLSTTNGRVPIQGFSKFYRTRLSDAIVANTGAHFPKRLTTQVIRRTVATRLAEQLGDEGDKLIKRVLGHSDGSVTAIYNRYGYVKEMRRILEIWANELVPVSSPDSSHASAVRSVVHRHQKFTGGVIRR